jgi:hypothetical protein
MGRGVWLILWACATVAPSEIEMELPTISWAINVADSNYSARLYQQSARTWAAPLDDERVIVFSGLVDGTIRGTAKRIVPCCDGEDFTQAWF